MGFATPLLSLTGLSLKLFPAVMSANVANLACAEPANGSHAAYSGADEQQDFSTHYPNVFTMRKRSTRRTSRSGAGRSRNPAPANAAQLSLPWLSDESDAPATPPLLKIVQREPRKQPECLLISGRMADVCAALERMACNE